MEFPTQSNQWMYPTHVHICDTIIIVITWQVLVGAELFVEVPPARSVGVAVAPESFRPRKLVHFPVAVVVQNHPERSDKGNGTRNARSA